MIPRRSEVKVRRDAYVCQLQSTSGLDTYIKISPLLKLPGTPTVWIGSWMSKIWGIVLSNTAVADHMELYENVN